MIDKKWVIPHSVIWRYYFHHPLICHWWRLKSFSLRGFVKILAMCSSVLTRCIDNKPVCTCRQKWWYLIFKCFGPRTHFWDLCHFYGPRIIFEDFTVYHCIVYVDWNSFILVSLVVVDRAIYSTWVEDKAMSVCNLDDQISGHPANMIR